MRKPRPFSYKPIYVDARQERLKAVEQRARQELQPETAAASQPAMLHGAFSAARRQQQDKGSFLSIPMLLAVVLILLFTVFVIVYS